MFFTYNKNLKTKSRRLRKNLTDAERLLWFKIRKQQINDLPFYRQRIISNYIIDFYCPPAKLAIEVDGGQHYEDKNLKQDASRTKDLQQLGIKILRFNNIDVLKNTDSVVQKIQEKTKIPPQSPFK